MFALRSLFTRMLILFNAISAQLISIGVSLSMYYLMLHIGGRTILALIVAILFYCIYCFKEYAKMQSSNCDGDYGLVNSHTSIQKRNQIISYTIAFLCAFGLELLFIAGTLSYALKGLSHFSTMNPKIFILLSCLLSLLHLPTNFIFYENCVRKYFRIPKLFKPQLTHKKNKLVFMLIIFSLFSSSIMVMVRCTLLCFAFFNHYNLVLSMLGLLLGLIYGFLSLYANYCIMHQTFCEFSHSFVALSNENIFLRTFISFKTSCTARNIKLFASISYAVYYSQPAIFMIFATHTFRLGNTLHTLLGFICGVIMIISYFFLTQNYLERLFIVNTKSSERSPSKGLKDLIEY